MVKKESKLESFWKNDLKNIQMNLQNYPVRTHLEKTIGQTVKFKTLTGNRGHPGILGYSPFNEPHQVGFDKCLFEKQFLSEFYRNELLRISIFLTLQRNSLQCKLIWRSLWLPDLDYIKVYQ